MSYDSFPEELKKQKQWVVWKLEIVKDKKTKVPYKDTAQLASSTNPDNWITFEESVKLLETKQFNGIG